MKFIVFCLVAVLSSPSEGYQRGRSGSYQSYIERAVPVLSKRIAGNDHSETIRALDTLSQRAALHIASEASQSSSSYAVPPTQRPSSGPGYDYRAPLPRQNKQTTSYLEHEPQIDVVPIIRPRKLLSGEEKYGPCEHGLYRTIRGRCVTPRVSKDVYLYKAPPQEIEFIRSNVDYTPKVHYNYVFLEAPSYDHEALKPIVVPPPKEKTLVYVLNKKPAPITQEVIEVPSEITEPEVFFINVAEDENPILPGGIDLKTALRQSGQTNELFDQNPLLDEHRGNFIDEVFAPSSSYSEPVDANQNTHFQSFSNSFTKSSLGAPVTHTLKDTYGAPLARPIGPKQNPNLALTEEDLGLSVTKLNVAGRHVLPAIHGH